MFIILIMVNNILLNSLIVTCYNYNNWYPVLPVNSYNYNGPDEVELLNKKMVLWKKGNDFVLQDNICPHRCASLSEGYIDKNSGNLCCSYHGWEFNPSGCVENIPQNENSFFTCNLKTYPTKIHSNLLWVFLGDNNIDIDDLFNNSVIHSFNCVDDYFMRDVLYSSDILLENLFDPSHIPFAHHKLQSFRENASPVSSKLYYKNDNRLDIKFNDFTLPNKKYRSGIMRFTNPCYYELCSNHSNINLSILFSPVSKRKTRVFIGISFKKMSLDALLFKSLPKYVRHSLINNFLDSDHLLLTKQESNLLYMNNYSDVNNPLKNYKIRSVSDNPIIFYNQWKSKKYYNRESLNKNINTIDIDIPSYNVFNKYDQHIKYCKYCNNAYKNLEVGIKMFSSLLIAYSWLDNNIFSFLAGLFLFLEYKSFIIYLQNKPYNHDKI